MIARLIMCLCACLSFTACGTAPQYAKALEEPVKTTAAAAKSVDFAQKDFIRVQALGAITDPSPFPQPLALESVVCDIPPGLQIAEDGLTVFSDSADLVSKVAAAPTDTSYAAYVRQFRKNAAAEAAAKQGVLPSNQETMLSDKAKACMAAFVADREANATLGTPSGTDLTKFAADPIGYIEALNTFIKALLGTIETAQREAAVRATVKATIPAMRAAQQQLASSSGASFGPRVIFASGTPQAVIDGNRSLLGASLGIHRWFIAQEIDRLWMKLGQCRTGVPTPGGGGTSRPSKGMNCLADFTTRRDLDDLVEDIYAYRELATVNAGKMLSDLNVAIDNADRATDLTFAQALDAIIGVADAVSSLSDSYGKLQKAR